MTVFGHHLVVTSLFCIASLRTSYRVQGLEEGEEEVLFLPHALPPPPKKKQNKKNRTKKAYTPRAFSQVKNTHYR